MSAHDVGGNTSLKTSLCTRLGIDLPIIQAPMAGGWTTPALVAAVCNAGGLGMLAAARLSLEQLRDQIDAVRRLTSRPFGVNFLLAPPDAAPTDVSAIQRALDVGRSKLGLMPGSTALQLPPSQTAAQFDLVCETRVPIVGFAMGDPGPWAERAKHGGAFVMAMATTVDDALRLQASGVDAIVAQGSEAGGHRSSLDLPSDAEAPLVGLLALVPQMVDAVQVPVIAAGGIMDGRGVLAALVLGAQAAQLGTRFLLATESGTFDAYRQRLIEAAEIDTVVTRSLTGRAARALRNDVVRTVESAGASVLGWPYQALAAEDVYRAAIANNDAAWAPLLAGQGLRLARKASSAAEIMASLKEELALQLEALNRPA
ncbi:NAD(P)H-dependent flavin oxidoreductase [Piscinibacter sp.]|jgi:nitronate monooxygenase|uniref:NAD(P)H-dependent flavin oxidoreductase n=1 Tax=Piscinibacter sp. TaxID=1903157 RepID=UPI002F3F48EF